MAKKIFTSDMDFVNYGKLRSAGIKMYDALPMAKAITKIQRMTRKKRK